MANKFHWKKQKAIGMYLNRRQHNNDFDPLNTTQTELLLENGNYLVRESSSSSDPHYIITE